MVLWDPDLPGADGILAAPGRAAVERFLSDRGWVTGQVVPVQAFYQPGRSARVRFRAEAAQRSGPASELTLTVECRRSATPLPPVPASDDVTEPISTIGGYDVWAFPYDPGLPGLPAAASGSCLPERFRPRAHDVQVDPVGYRPRQRAVLRYEVADTVAGGGCRLFAKVLRPARAREAMQVARALRGAEIPVRLGLPFARRASGVLLAPVVGGRPLRDPLLAGGALPAPGRLARLGDTLARLSADLPETPATRSPRGVPTAARARLAADVVARLLPGPTGDAARRLAEAIAGSVPADPAPLQVVHGDLHEAQIIVAGDGSLGLVDLDDLGYGDPVLDAATLSAHLLVLGASAPAGISAGILGYRAAVRSAFLDRLACDPAALAWREAYALLLLATGPFRVLRNDWPARVAARVDLAAGLLTPG